LLQFERSDLRQKATARENQIFLLFLSKDTYFKNTLSKFQKEIQRIYRDIFHEEALDRHRAGIQIIPFTFLFYFEILIVFGELVAQFCILALSITRVIELENENFNAVI